MKKKHIEVDNDVHTKLKAQASSKGMTLKGYLKYLAEKNETH